MSDDVTGTAQWRLAEIQLANWGTFDHAIYRIPVARQGHLITGPSGSGKSSLLDAIAAVLTPDKWLRFNEAAQGAGPRTAQRNVLSYVRGAWSRTTDETEDRVVSSYLRMGATWSGIVLRYENGVDAPVSLCRLFFAKATVMSASEVSDLCLLDRSSIDLRDLEPFAAGGIEARKAQARWTDAVITTNGGHSRFYARMRSLFGIPDEGALQLLHKTQSAKNLDSLDQLFRDYMLERPATFELAKTAVEQFGELRDAHDHVVQLRLQRDHLQRVRVASDSFDEGNNEAQRSSRLIESIPGYQRRRSLELAETDLASSSERLIGLVADEQRATGEHASAEEDFEIAQRQVHELGGGDVEQLQHRVRSAQAAETATGARWESLRTQLEGVGIDRAPESSREFAELMAEIDRLSASGADIPGASHEQHDRLSGARQLCARITGDIDALRRSGTTVPGELVSVRAELADALSLPISALPFAAELLEVLPEYESWTGAIERALRPFALTMLVRSENLDAVRRWADGHRVRARLVFEEVDPRATQPRPASSGLSLLNRVRVAESPFQVWVTVALSERYDIACVAHPDDLDDHVRAVTINGQMKTSSTRYEKDDRTSIDDRSRWVLGDRDAKLEALIERLRAAEAERAEAQRIVDALTDHRDAMQQRTGLLRAVRAQSWADVDRWSAASVVRDLRQRLEELSRGDGDLQTALAASVAARDAKDAALTRLGSARLEHAQEEERARDLAEAVSAFRVLVAADPEIAEEVAAVLDGRFRSVQRSITRTNITAVGQEVQTALVHERDRAFARASKAGNELTALAAQFRERWPSSSRDLTASLEDRQGYIDILDEIIAHGLPEYEERFRRLLRERSRDLIGELVSDILSAPKEIEERVRPVNASLIRSRFDEGRFLRLRVKSRRTETVARFIADLRSITEGSWGEDDVESAERRFATLAELMRRFESSEHADRMWRNQCLDTRLHVTFLADEIDEHGRAHATYDSGAAMSGGQQQKLVVFCLAAALRYRLADPDERFAAYGTIVLDEAFDKADTRYTRMALDVFVEFGFHMVLATPQKLLQTIEPYVGAATSIENPTRRRSEVAGVEWRARP